MKQWREAGLPDLLVYSQNYLSSRLRLAALTSEALVLHNLQLHEYNSAYVPETTFAYDITYKISHNDTIWHAKHS